jgi:hypothetical protein
MISFISHLPFLADPAHNIPDQHESANQPETPVDPDYSRLVHRILPHLIDILQPLTITDFELTLETT